MASIIWELSVGPLAVLEFDCVPAESHEASSEITEHVVEEGANMNDHVKPNQRVITLEGMITNTPLNETTIRTMLPIASIVGVQQPLLVTVGDRNGQPMNKKVNDASLNPGYVSPFNVPGFPRNHTRPTFIPRVTLPTQHTVSGSVFASLTREDRVKTCFDALVTLCLTGREITLVTDLQEYDRCFIKKVSAPRAAVDAIKFSLEIRQVLFADTQVVEIRKKKPREKRAEAEVNKGPTARYAPVTAAQDTFAREQVRGVLKAAAGIE